MEHPFLKNIRLLIIYSAIWLLISAIHIAVLLYFYHIEIVPAVIDGLLFNLMFAVLGIPVWYVVRFVRPARASVFNAMINHVTAAAIILAIWIGVSTTILHDIFNSDTNYQEFLNRSIAWRVISGFFFYSILVLIYFMIIYYNDLQERIIREARLNEILRTAELDLLKSQINPHFLFNSLNSVSSLTITNPEKAQDMIIKLSDFLRYSISHKDTAFSEFGSEISNSKRYLEIEQVRFGSRLSPVFDISPECSGAMIPAMLLQPLYENAVKHGVYESTEAIMIHTSCSMETDNLLIIITNNYEQIASSRKGAGIGLKNISERLRLIYKEDQLLTIENSGSVFTVKLKIPQGKQFENLRI
ncbi:MAG: histidine kinase [Bacteroidia bacterium]|nr:histidine kinase [Bacteroidia bacterium]